MTQTQSATYNITGLFGPEISSSKFPNFLSVGTLSVKNVLSQRYSDILVFEKDLVLVFIEFWREHFSFYLVLVFQKDLVLVFI